MPTTCSAQDLLEPVDDASGVPLPPRFAEALGEVRAAIARCEKAGVPNGTVFAALMTELMPRLVEAYGSDGAAAMLRRLAGQIAGDGQLPTSKQ